MPRLSATLGLMNLFRGRCVEGMQELLFRGRLRDRGLFAGRSARKPWFFYELSTVSRGNWKMGLLRGRCARHWRETVVRRSLLMPNCYGVVVWSALAKCGTVVGENKINYSFAFRTLRMYEVQNCRRWNMELQKVSRLGRGLCERFGW